MSTATKKCINSVGYTYELTVEQKQFLLPIARAHGFNHASIDTHGPLWSCVWYRDGSWSSGISCGKKPQEGLRDWYNSKAEQKPGQQQRMAYCRQIYVTKDIIVGVFDVSPDVFYGVLVDVGKKERDRTQLKRDCTVGNCGPVITITRLVVPVIPYKTEVS